jgi:ribonuclease HII
MEYLIGIDEVRRAASKRPASTRVERGERASPKSFVIGIDEVGRGALAGPVVVAALAVPKGRRFYREIRDSKALAPLAREELAKLIKNTGLVYAIARVYPRVIDRMNIARAANLAAERTLRRLFLDLGIEGSNASVYLDGGLYIRNKRYQQQQDFRIMTVVKGDQKFNAVKLASVVAKVTRDRYMVKLHKKFPKYGFDAHKGYGTKVHLEAIRKYGPSEVHRLTFVKKYHKMK